MSRSNRIFLVVAAVFLPFVSGCGDAAPIVDSIVYTGWATVTSDAAASHVDVPAPAEAKSAAKPDGPIFQQLMNGCAAGAAFERTKYYFNGDAATAMEQGVPSTFPVGAVIVKEKWAKSADASPRGYVAMVKREPGYDVKHGDWEYVVDDLAGKSERGQIASCVDCHQGAAARDGVFGTAWKDQVRFNSGGGSKRSDTPNEIPSLIAPSREWK